MEGATVRFLCYDDDNHGVGDCSPPFLFVFTCQSFIYKAFLFEHGEKKVTPRLLATYSLTPG